MPVIITNVSEMVAELAAEQTAQIDHLQSVLDRAIRFNDLFLNSGATSIRQYAAAVAVAFNNSKPTYPMSSTALNSKIARSVKLAQASLGKGFWSKANAYEAKQMRQGDELTLNGLYSAIFGKPAADKPTPTFAQAVVKSAKGKSKGEIRAAIAALEALLS